MADFFATVEEWFTDFSKKPQLDMPTRQQRPIIASTSSGFSEVINDFEYMCNLEEAGLAEYRKKKRDERKKLAKRKPRTHRRHTEMSDFSSDTNGTYVLSKRPGVVNITGPLAKMNVNTLFETIRQEMKLLYSTSNRNAKVIKQYIRRKFNYQLMNQQQDLAFVHLIQCHRAAEDVLGNQEFYKETEKMVCKLHEYEDIQNIMLLHCMANYHHFYKELTHNNYGAADLAIQEARKNLQCCPVGSWTAGQLELEGGLQNMFAYIWPLESRQYHEQSFKSFQKSREHFIEHDGHNEGSYSWVYCLFQMQTCLLQLPLRKNIQFVLSNHAEKRMTLLHRFDVTLSDIHQAEKIMQKAREEFLHCDAKYMASFRYNMLLAEIGLELRHAQILKRLGKYQLAFDAVVKSLDSCDKILSHINDDKNAYYLSYMKEWVEDCLKESSVHLRSQLHILVENQSRVNAEVSMKDLAQIKDVCAKGIRGAMQPTDSSTLDSFDDAESDVE